jgi:hypothetical protein
VYVNGAAAEKLMEKSPPAAKAERVMVAKGAKLPTNNAARTKRRSNALGVSNLCRHDIFLIRLELGFIYKNSPLL